MKVKYQADNDLRQAIVAGTRRRRPEIDFRSASASNLDGVPDSDVLRLAALHGRILVSHDYNTMPVHFREFVRTQSSPGVLLIRQDLPVVEAIESLVLIWDASDAEEWRGRLCLIPSLGTVVTAPLHT